MAFGVDAAVDDDIARILWQPHLRIAVRRFVLYNVAYDT